MSQVLHSKYTALWMDWFRADRSFDDPNVNHCCQDMSDALTNICADHSDDAFACPDMVVCFRPVFHEYGLIVHEPAQSIRIRFCPWCGERLPKSLRDEWFDRLKTLGVDAPFDEISKVPEDYKSSLWWRMETT